MKNNGNQRDNGKENELVIGGYSFETQEEYEKALEETSLQVRMRYSMLVQRL